MEKKVLQDKKNFYDAIQIQTIFTSPQTSLQSFLPSVLQSFKNRKIILLQSNLGMKTPRLWFEIKILSLFQSTFKINLSKVKFAKNFPLKFSIRK